MFVIAAKGGTFLRHWPTHFLHIHTRLRVFFPTLKFKPYLQSSSMLLEFILGVRVKKAFNKQTLTLGKE